MNDNKTLKTFHKSPAIIKKICIFVLMGLYTYFFKLYRMIFSGKQIFPLITILFFLTIMTVHKECHAQSIIFRTHPKYEVRAVWMTTIGGLDWPHNYAQSQNSVNKQKREFIDILEKLKEANINTVLLQTRIRGTVIYPSAIEPWDGCFSGIPGKSPYYDPLAFAIEECHKRGMEIQAWIVTIPIGKWESIGCKTLRKRYPDIVVKKGSEGYMDPAKPMTASYIASICKEITDKYDIDGIHLDYIRYPETWKLNILDSQARENITTIVKKIHDEIKKTKPWVKLSCSPIGKYDDLSRYSSLGWNANIKGYQDAQNWLRQGLIDQLYPMMYFRNNQFYPFVLDWKENNYGRTIVPGLGIYFLSQSEGDWPLEEIQRQLYFVRTNNMGYAFFRNDFLYKNVKNILSFMKETFNLYPALIPPMTWENEDKPDAPQDIKIIKDKRSETVYWNKIKKEKRGGIMYNVYASKKYPVDINDVRNLLAQRLRNNYLTIRKKDHLFYAVTSIDRYGNESEATQQFPTKSLSDYSIRFIKNDGKKMLLPEKIKTLDAEYILIKSITGALITIYPYKGTYADISKIKNGQYIVYSLSNKGVVHRLGLLCIYR